MEGSIKTPFSYKGLRRLPDINAINKYLNDKTVPKFDFHSKYRDHSVFVLCHPKTGKPLDDKERWMSNVFPFGNHLYCTLTLELGDRGMLIGKAFEYYTKIKNQLEREMIKDFKKHDLFESPDDHIGIRVIDYDADGHWVYYEKYGPSKDLDRRFWQCPTLGRQKKRTWEFATAVMKLNPKRYIPLLHTDLTVPK
jgi:hypothetical protein